MLIFFNVFLLILFTYTWMKARESIRKGKKQMKIGIRHGEYVSAQLMQNLSIIVIIWSFLFLMIQLVSY